MANSVVWKRLLDCCIDLTIPSAVMLTTLFSSSAFPADAAGIFVRVSEIRSSNAGCFVTFGLRNEFIRMLSSASFDVSYLDANGGVLEKGTVTIGRTAKLGIEQFGQWSLPFSCPVNEIGKIKLEWNDFTQLNGDAIYSLTDVGKFLGTLTSTTEVNYDSPVRWSNFDGSDEQLIKLNLVIPGCANCK